MHGFCVWKIEALARRLGSSLRSRLITLGRAFGTAGSRALPVRAGGRKVKIPTLSQTARQGWGNLGGVSLTAMLQSKIRASRAKCFHPITPKPGVLGPPDCHSRMPKAGILATPVYCADDELGSPTSVTARPDGLA